MNATKFMAGGAALVLAAGVMVSPVCAQSNLGGYYAGMYFSTHAVMNQARIASRFKGASHRTAARRSVAAPRQVAYAATAAPAPAGSAKVDAFLNSAQVQNMMRARGQ